MNIEHLQSLYTNNVENIFTPSRFADLASHSSNIQGYSFLNRVLLQIQNRYATEVKSEESWNLDGCILNEDAIPMGVITPVTKTTYYNSETDLEVKADELNQTEFTKAILIGLIYKKIDIVDIKCTLVYDIKNTINKRIEKRKSTRKIKLSSIYELLESIGISVVREDNGITTFDNSNNTLKIGDDELAHKLSVILRSLAIKYIEQQSDSIEITEDEKRCITDYAVYSGLTFFKFSSPINFEYIHDLYLNEVEKNRLQTLVDMLDDIENMLNSHVFISDEECWESNDEGRKTHIAHRAAMLLNILEANYELQGLKGV